MDILLIWIEFELFLILSKICTWTWCDFCQVSYQTKTFPLRMWFVGQVISVATQHLLCWQRTHFTFIRKKRQLLCCGYCTLIQLCSSVFNAWKCIEMDINIPFSYLPSQKSMLSMSVSDGDKAEENKEEKWQERSTKKDEREPSCSLHALLQHWNLCTSWPRPPLATRTRTADGGWADAVPVTYLWEMLPNALSVAAEVVDSGGGEGHFQTVHMMVLLRTIYWLLSDYLILIITQQQFRQLINSGGLKFPAWEQLND